VTIENVQNSVTLRMTESAPITNIPREFLGPPGDFNPTLLLFIVSASLAIISVTGHFVGHWPDWISFWMNVLALHLVGTVIHDASHNVAHRNRIVNSILGHGSALMLGFVFPVFTRVHMQHHANVNDPKNDPDYIVSNGGPLFLIGPRFFYHEIFFFQRRLWRKYELLEWFISRGIVATIFWFASQHGQLGFLLNFWMVPAGVVGLLLGLFFDYFPHNPHRSQERWGNARIYASPVLNALILGQNYHLVHHLWPSVPWYKFQGAYYATKPLLDAKGCQQTLGLTEPKLLRKFLYDFFIGIHFKSKPDPQQTTPPNQALRASEIQADPVNFRELELEVIEQAMQPVGIDPMIAVAVAPERTPVRL
jgi:beta-carotene hydroxylase